MAKKKIRRPADVLAGKGSLSDKLKKQRQAKKKMMDSFFSGKPDPKPKKKKGK